MSTFSELFKKAHGAISSLRGANSYFLGKDGDIVYSKNNVCVHETKEMPGSDEDVVHMPGYLTIHCLHDEHLGATLVLQWLPNKTLEKNPASIRCVSPRSRNKESRENGTAPHKPTTSSAVTESDEDESISLITTASVEDEGASRASTEICVEVNGDMVTVSSVPQDRPTTLEENGFSGLGVPQINVIPNTPVDPRCLDDYDVSAISNDDAKSDSSGATSGADELSDKEEQAHNSSSCDESDSEDKATANNRAGIQPYRQNYVTMLSTTPEQFAKEHNLMLESNASDDPSVVALSKERVIFQQKTTSTSLFSVNLGKMKSMRLFYSNPEYTSGQLVLTSPDSQYKILHFHHGGLDKLAQLFEQWNAVKAKSMKEDSPSPVPDRHLVVFHPHVSRDELDPEEGLYDRVGWDLWKSYMNKDGSIDDSFTIRKTVYFAYIDPTLRKEIWPFLLHMYPWSSTFEQRDAVRNDLFLEYQTIKKKRMRKMNSGQRNVYLEIESSVWKDVVRTDRKNEYFAGDDNPNLDVMKDILMAYAAMHPEIGYIQGMSDLLAPLMVVLQNEADAYWCFVGLMQKTLFACSPSSENNMMEVNLDQLRELMKVFVPEFFNYLAALGEDALKLLFVHRWLLLFFKREFAQADSLNMWEACWAKPYLHLFICIAIIKTYSPDIMGLHAGHDEVLLYFASIANHIDATVIVKLARGLMYRFCRMERIPCTLASLFDQDEPREQWTTHISVRNFECTRVHGDHEPCPFANA